MAERKRLCGMEKRRKCRDKKLRTRLSGSIKCWVCSKWKNPTSVKKIQMADGYWGQVCKAHTKSELLASVVYN